MARLNVQTNYLWVAVCPYRKSVGSGLTHWVHPNSARSRKREVRDFMADLFVGGWPAARKAGWRVVHATLEVAP